MKINRSYLLCLIAFLCIGPMALRADSGPQGTYKGTVQCTLINEQYILQRGLNDIANKDINAGPHGDPEAIRGIATKMTQQGNRDYIANLKSYRVTDANPLQMTIADGAAPGQYRLDISPANENYIKFTLENAWNPTPDNKYGVIHATWRTDGFEIVRTQTNVVARIAGTFSGSQVSGQWSLSENGTQMLAGVFSATKTGGASGVSKMQPPVVGADGEYNGTVSSSDANAASGHIQFTVSGNSVHGTASGQWAQAPSESSDQTEADKEAEREAESDAFSGSFAAPVNPDTGKFEAKLTGKIGDFDFTGHIRGTIQGYNASGTWDAVNQYGTSTGTWTASRPAPVVPILDAGGVGGEVVDSQPPGISGVGDVPGPQDLPETGTGLLLPGLLAAAGIGLKSMLDASVTPPPTVDYGPVAPPADTGGFDDSVTDSLIDSASAPAPQPAAPAPDYGPQYTQAQQDAQDATDKYTAMQKQLADFEQGADPTDPQYAALKKQYTDYLDYYKQKADADAATADAIAAAAVKQQNTQVLKDYWGNDKEVVYDPTTGQWHDAETGNLFDPDKWQESQKQIADDSAWSQADLNKMQNQQDADGKAMKKLIAQEKLKEKELEYLEKLQETAYNKGIIDPGSRHDFFTSTQKLMDDITDGKTVTVPQIRDAEKYLHDRLTGSAQPESSLSLPENQIDYWQADKTALYNTTKEMVTGRDADGHFTVLGVMGMMSLHAAALMSGGWTLGALGTKWVGEEAITAASTVFAEGDAIDHGASSLEALGAGYADAAAVLVFNSAGEGLHALATNPSVKAGVGEMFNSATNFGKRMLGMPVTEAITPELQAAKDLVTKLLQTKNANPLANADLIAQIYSNGGIKKLAQLQAAGLISKEEAAALNAQLHPLLNRHIDLGTYNAIKQFQERTGVRINKLLVSDSGSTAKMGSRFDPDQLKNYADSHGMTLDEASRELQSRYGNPKCNTDRDVTVVPDFDKEDVEQYARDHGISTEDAYYKLHNLCTNNIRDNVNATLIGKGFQGGINDVKFQTYAGFGTASGRIDSYSAGFSSRATETSGVAKQWATDKMGDPTSLGGRQVSGSAAVDQNNLNLKTFTGELPLDPDKFSPKEFANYSGQQVTAVMQSTDPKTVAKAMVRQVKLGKVVDRMSGDAVGGEQLASAGIIKAPPPMNLKLVQLAQKIADHPDQTDKFLFDAQLSKEQFQRFSLYQLQRFHGTLTANMG
jgi:hypothetical protein